MIFDKKNHVGKLWERRSSKPLGSASPLVEAPPTGLEPVTLRMTDVDARCFASPLDTALSSEHVDPAPIRQHALVLIVARHCSWISHVFDHGCRWRGSLAAFGPGVRRRVVVGMLCVMTEVPGSPRLRVHRGAIQLNQSCQADVCGRSDRPWRAGPADGGAVRRSTRRVPLDSSTRVFPDRRSRP